MAASMATGRLVADSAVDSLRPGRKTPIQISARYLSSSDGRAAEAALLNYFVKGVAYLRGLDRT